MDKSINMRRKMKARAANTIRRTEKRKRAALRRALAKAQKAAA